MSRAPTAQEVAAMAAALRIGIGGGPRIEADMRLAADMLEQLRRERDETSDANYAALLRDLSDRERADAYVRRMKEESPGPFGTGFGSRESLAAEFASIRVEGFRAGIERAAQEADRQGDIALGGAKYRENELLRAGIYHEVAFMLRGMAARALAPPQEGTLTPAPAEEGK